MGKRIADHTPDSDFIANKDIVDVAAPPREPITTGQNHTSPGNISFAPDQSLVAPRARCIRLRVAPHDVLPEGVLVHLASTTPASPSRSPSPDPAHQQRRCIQIVRQWITKPNKFGVWREYYSQPSVIPDLDRSLQTFQTGRSLVMQPLSLQPPTLQEALGPFPNYSTYLHARWLWQNESGTISAATNQNFINTVLRDKEFKPEDVVDICFTTLRSKVAEFQPSPFLESDGWKESEVQIKVPLGPQKGDQIFPSSAKLGVPGLHHRSIVDVIKRVLSTDRNVLQYHFHPFRQYAVPPGSPPSIPPQRVVDDIYNSDAMIKEYENLQRSPREPGCNFERVILALQFWSDATQLANFGSAKLWPVYMYFGNQPKWARSRSDMHSCHDIAHIPSLPESFQDFVCEQRGYPADARLKTHCRHELFHQVWCILLDKKFVKAYKHGILVVFPDGSLRRVYLRIVTYSADYPEKVIIATIRNLGTCLCPRCLVKWHEIRKLGLKADGKLRQLTRRVDDEKRRLLVKKARKFIYKDRKRVGSTWVEALLGSTSLVPTKNAFSTRLHELGFDYFQMLCSDFMHEVELGEWKGILIHLIRMLHALGGDSISKLDERKIPPFGRDTIRKFIYNVSELKQLAARDFEDILQCAIPAFEGLFPEPIDCKIQELLFVLADWHSLAKLRLHTDSTLGQLEAATRVLGQE
ncbi:hypothetical protein FRC05_009001, partial [Tulasnella sp. 425]